MVLNVCVSGFFSHGNFIDRRKGSLSLERYRKIKKSSWKWRTNEKARNPCRVASKRPCATFSTKSWHKLIHISVPFVYLHCWLGCYNLHVPCEINYIVVATNSLNYSHLGVLFFYSFSWIYVNFELVFTIISLSCYVSCIQYNNLYNILFNKILCQSFSISLFITFHIFFFSFSLLLVKYVVQIIVQVTFFWIYQQ